VQKNAQSIKDQDEPFDVLEYYRRYRNEELIKYMPYQPGLRVLDCGCREGVLLDQLDGRTEATWGVDRSLPTAALSLAPDQTSIAYGHRLPFATEIFDVVFGSETLHRGGRPAHVVSELARVLRPNGWLILWESRRQLRHASMGDLSRWMRKARLVSRYAEPFDCLAFPAALTISLIPPLARSYTAQTLTKAMFALDGMLLRVPALYEKSWHLIVAAQKEDPGDG
jgi:SAM-dependent methyltransferase